MGYIGMCLYEGYNGFQAVYSGIGYKIKEFGSRIGYHFPGKMINWLKILVYTRVTGNCHSKVYLKKNQIGMFKCTQLSLKATLE